MKKNKILGGLTLASVLALSGCSYVDNQQSFMDKVTSYIDSQDNQAKQELMDQLKDYLNDEKEMWKRECERLKGLYYLENEKDEHLSWKRVDVE